MEISVVGLTRKRCLYLWSRPILLPSLKTTPYTRKKVYKSANFISSWNQQCDFVCRSLTLQSPLQSQRTHLLLTSSPSHRSWTTARCIGINSEETKGSSFNAFTHDHLFSELSLCLLGAEMFDIRVAATSDSPLRLLRHMFASRRRKSRHYRGIR